MSREVCARMRNSSVTTFSRASERTRANQRHFGDRLGQEIVGAGFEAAHAVGRLIERGHHHHRDVVRGRIALEPAAHLEAVHVRHHHVEQHEIAFGALADRERVLAAGGGDDVEIFGREPGLEQLHIGGDVVDDQNAGRHDSRTCRENGEWSR